MDRVSDRQFAAEEEVASVQVAVRVRPFNKREIRNNTICCIRMEGKNTVLLDPASVRQEKEDVNKRVFQYDYSYWSFGEKANANGSTTFHTQEDVFRDLGEVILSNAFKGYNCSLMAYGQTGSGKSYSMMGGPEPHERGIIPRISQALFDRSAAEAARAYNEQSVELKAVGKERTRDRCSYKVEASYLEIYAERVRDLLQPSKNQKSGGLRVREHPQTGPYVEDLTKCAVNDYKELEEVMLMGNKERTVASTNMNAESSRSHAVFTITFTQTRYDDITNMSTDKVSKIQLVDLAGSERVDASGVTGVHLKEAANINKSLTTLGMVISALAKMSAGKGAADDDDDEEEDVVSRTRTMKPATNLAGKKAPTPANQTLRPTTGATTFVPFRNSVLTWLLKDSLGGNSKTIMIATISPSDINYDETLSTLRYAARAKKIVNKAVVNEDPNARIIRALRQEVEELRAKLAASNTDPEEVEKLREQLEQSKRIIADINKSWEQKLEETRNMQVTRMLELQSQGIAVKVDTSVPYLVNLNEDPSLSESIVYYLKPGFVYVGRSPVQDGPTSMILRGLKVKDKHCMFSNENNNVYIIPYKYDAKDFAETYVNGELLIAKRLLQHSDRLIIGQNHVFRFSSSETPAQSESRADARMRNRLGRALSFTDLDKPANFDWDFATRERTVTQGKLQDLLPAGEKDKEHYRLLEEKLQLMQQEQEKATEVIRNQKAQYEQLLSKYREDEIKRMKEEKAMPAEESELLEFQRKNKQRLTEELMKVLPLVEEANAVCQALGKSSHFEVELVSHAFSAPTPAILLNRAPSIEQSNSKDDNLGGGRRGHEHSFSIRSNVSLLTPLQRLHQMKETRIQIKVTRGRGAQRGRYSLWSKDEFIDKLFLLRDMYNRISEFGQEEAANCVDPLAVTDFEPQLIGKAHIYLESLRFGVGIQQRTQILDHRGDYAGLLSVQLYCTDMELDDDSSVDSEESIEPFDDDDDDEDTRSERGTRSNPGQRGSILSSNSVDFDAPSPAHSAGSPLTMAALARANNSMSPRGGPLSPRRGGAVSPPPLSPHAHPLTGSASMPVGGRLRLKHEKTAGRFKLKHEIESFPPVVGERLPIVLKIARADRITGLGVQNILVKYRFHNDRDTYQTDICEITSEHSMSMATFSNSVRRRRLPERLSRPVEIGYVMRHDIEPVDDKFMRFLQHDAITFEVWGSFYTGDLESKMNVPLSAGRMVSRPMSPILSPRSSERRESFLKAIDAPSSTASNHSSTAPSPAPRPNSPQPLSSASRSVTPSVGSGPVPPLPLTAVKFALAGGQASPNVPSPGQPMSAESVLRRQVPRHAHTRSQFEGELQKEYQQRKGKRTNMLFVGVDVEEMDTQGRWNPCGLKETPEEDPAAVFRISPGGDRPKRFIIHVIQVDPYDFILESCASTKIDSMRIVAGGDDEEDHKRQAVNSRRSSLQNPSESGNQNELRAPISLNVWEQSYQIHNKLISITAHWPPELTSKHFVRRQTPTGERVLMSISLQLYMSRLTSPITLNPVIAFKVYETATPVSMMRSFFRGHSPTTGRLHKLGTYFRVIKEGSEKGLESIFHEHHKQLSKLEHNMRIEQIQQHLTLIRILKAHGSAQIDEAQRGFEASVQALSKLASATMGTDLEPHNSDMTPPRTGDPAVSSLKISVERAIESELRIKMGFLFKRGKFHVTWKRRWFLLRPPYLFYFKHKDDRREKGVVDLIGATVSLGQASRDPFSFEIHTSTRVWYLQASSEEDMHKWVEGILEFNEFAE